MNGAITNEGKVTVSLTIRQWAGVIAALLMVGFYVYRIETGRIDSVRFKEVQEVRSAKADSTLAVHSWRIRRVERRLGISRPTRVQEDDSGWFWQN